ncbi:putative phage holin [Actinacidiphila alni]|uniref:putative phage holin n=1 Tax=Actinacidiphila alni TaxID=380248 RepID=UPI0034529E8D
MTWSQWANAAASACVALSSLVFVVTYTCLAPWRATVAGRHVMAVTIVIGLLGTYTVAITLWPGTAPALRVARIVVVLSMAGLLAQRTWMVIRAQRRR